MAKPRAKARRTVVTTTTRRVTKSNPKASARGHALALRAYRTRERAFVADLHGRPSARLHARAAALKTAAERALRVSGVTGPRKRNPPRSLARTELYRTQSIPAYKARPPRKEPNRRARRHMRERIYSAPLSDEQIARMLGTGGGPGLFERTPRAKRNPKKGTTSMARKRKRTAAQRAATRRMIAANKRKRAKKNPSRRRRRKNPAALIVNPSRPRRRKRNPMAKHRKRRKNPHRRSRRRNPHRRHRRRNPGMGGGTFGLLVKTSLPALATGAGLGLIDAKILANKPAIVGVLTKVGVGALSAVLLRRRAPAVGAAIASAAFGSVGHALGVKFGGGVIAGSKQQTIQELAAMAATDDETFGVLTSELEGMGVLSIEGMGSDVVDEAAAAFAGTEPLDLPDADF